MDKGLGRLEGIFVFSRAIDTWKQRARFLKIEIHAIYLAYRDPGVPR